MLILSRKEGESIRLGEDIEIKIVQTAKGSAKIGIEAPKNILILRKELCEEIKDKNLFSVGKDEAILDGLSQKIKQ
ncbi:carbon storage regulator CsrA [Campylobacter troglodytis]|uniref:carbon storage regulator CsrA n=1 Tax=Campylobacter troglodytis TaxID=654363 RepID=UPI001156F739|nr:carbon storage regulator CsrA [Campylobacter troglodytis]TQR61161.1 carbon storage regulator [Campylobacter troglodytis]